MTASLRTFNTKTVALVIAAVLLVIVTLSVTSSSGASESVRHGDTSDFPVNPRCRGCA